MPYLVVMSLSPCRKPRTGRDDALQRLHYDGGKLVVVRLNDGLGGGQVVERRDEHQVGDGLGDAAAVGLGQRELQRGAGRNAHQRIVAAAVVAALELQHLFLAGVGAGDAHGLEAGVGAAGGETHLVGAGDGLDQRLGQHNGLVVVGEEGAALLHGLDDGLHHVRVGMAQQHRPAAHQPVHVLVAADVPAVGTLAASDQEVLLRVEVEVAGVAAGQIAPCLFQQAQFFRSAIGHHFPSFSLAFGTSPGTCVAMSPIFTLATPS